MKSGEIYRATIDTLTSLAENCSDEVKEVAIIGVSLVAAVAIFSKAIK